MYQYPLFEAAAPDNPTTESRPAPEEVPKDRTAAPVTIPETLPQEVQDFLWEAVPKTVAQINRQLRRLQTVGGRIGSGLGLLIESIWGFTINTALSDFQTEDGRQIELAWMCEHGYNDFAVIDSGSASEWDPDTRIGECFRVEVKSMVASAAESKAHFDELIGNIGPHDLLVVILWEWKPVKGRPGRVTPQIRDIWIGNARELACLRDELHRQRGGTFVDPMQCPDGCDPGECPHGGEPLNANGTRERRSGPESRRGDNARCADNFGGLVRMLKCRGDAHRTIARYWAENATCRSYIDFIHRNFPAEEERAIPAKVMRRAAAAAGVVSDWDELRKVDRYRELIFQNLSTVYPSAISS